MAAASPSQPSSSAASSTSLPPGVSAPYAAINATDQSGLIAILAAFALGLVLVSISIRLYARHHFAGYRVDDYTFFAASILSVIQASLVLQALAEGQGKISGNLSPDKSNSIQKLSFASDLFYLGVLCLSKFSTSFLLLYLTPSRIDHRIIWSGVGAESIWAISAVLIEGIRCNRGQPWTDDATNCSNTFARWIYIAVFDCVTELGIVVTAILIVRNLQMNLKSKLIVVGAFSCRIPNIALSIIRLVFIHNSRVAETFHIWSARIISVTQIAIGVSIASSIVPYLKPFMMAYEQPTSSSYPNRSGRSDGSSRFKLSALTSKASTTATQTQTQTQDVEDDGELRDAAGRVRRKPVLKVGRLRPEQTRYSAKASAAPAPERSDADQDKKSDHDSEDSTIMIIKKGVEWSVRYDQESKQERASSTAETAETSASANPDDTHVARPAV
jgi:hypothetical protein